MLIIEKQGPVQIWITIKQCFTRCLFTSVMCVYIKATLVFGVVSYLQANFMSRLIHWSNQLQSLSSKQMELQLIIVIMKIHLWLSSMVIGFNIVCSLFQFLDWLVYRDFEQCILFHNASIYLAGNGSKLLGAVVRVGIFLHIFMQSGNLQKTPMQKYNFFIYISLVVDWYLSDAQCCSRFSQQLRQSCWMLRVHEPKEGKHRLCFLFM